MLGDLLAAIRIGAVTTGQPVLSVTDHSVLAVGVVAAEAEDKNISPGLADREVDFNLPAVNERGVAGPGRTQASARPAANRNAGTASPPLRCTTAERAWPVPCP